MEGNFFKAVINLAHTGNTGCKVSTVKCMFVFVCAVRLEITLVMVPTLPNYRARSE